MLKKFSLAWFCLLTSGVLGCAANVALTDAGDHRSPHAEQTGEGQSFEVQLPGDVTAESVIPAIVAAGHDQLAAVCESTPGATLRILSPLASGDYADVPCAALLDGRDVNGQPAGPLTSNEAPIGQAQQRIGPITFVACGLILGGSSFVLGKLLCPRGSTERDRQNCYDLGLGGGIALGILCSIPL